MVSSYRYDYGLTPGYEEPVYEEPAYVEPAYDASYDYAAANYSTGDYAPAEVWAEPEPAYEYQPSLRETGRTASNDWAEQNYSTGRFVPERSNWGSPSFEDSTDLASREWTRENYSSGIGDPHPKYGWAGVGWDPAPTSARMAERSKMIAQRAWTMTPSNQWAERNYTDYERPPISQEEYQYYLPVPGPHNNFLYKPEVDRVYETDSPWDSGDAYSTGQYAPSYTSPSEVDRGIDVTGSFRRALGGEDLTVAEPGWDVWADPILARDSSQRPSSGESTTGIRHSTRLPYDSIYLPPTHGRYHDDYYRNMAWESLAADPRRGVSGIDWPTPEIENSGIQSDWEFERTWDREAPEPIPGQNYPPRSLQRPPI